VTLHEVLISEPYAALRRGEIDVLVNWLAVEEPGFRTGPAIAYDERVLFAAADHKLAKRKTVRMDDLADYEVTQRPGPFPAAIEHAFCPAATPSGVPIPRRRTASTFGEIQTLVARGFAVQPTVASMAAKLAREDTVLVPIVDLPPLALGLIWRRARENKHIRALAEAARSLQPQQNQTATDR
jgi:DNA-binding transcriptional LysR family regulator